MAREEIIEVRGRIHALDKGNIIVKDRNRKQIAEFAREKHLRENDLLNVTCRRSKAEPAPMNQHMVSRYGAGVDASWGYVFMSEPEIERVE